MRHPRARRTPLDPRIAWANSIRKIVTRPDAINEDGSLNQQFFKPKKVVYAAEKAKWNDDDKENLYKGIEKYGIDPSSWKKIIEEFCPGRDVLFIRIKASRLIGSQGLNRYHGWIGTKAEVEAEYERNKAIGLATGCWKGGILVENDHGDAMKAIRERDERRRRRASRPGQEDQTQLEIPRRQLCASLFEQRTRQHRASIRELITARPPRAAS